MKNDLKNLFDSKKYQDPIVIKNEKYREQVLKIMRETDWKNLYPYISTPKIQTWKIYKYLKESIYGLQ